jgi:hypothetical protein
MDPIVEEHLLKTYFREYQSLRGEMVEILADEDLASRVGGASDSLGSLCREIGEIAHAYVESFRTFRLDFGHRAIDPRLEGSVAALSAWYAELDRQLMAALESLSEDDFAHRTISRSDFDVAKFAPLPPIQLDVYREALLIFYGKVSVYLRALGKALPGHWHAWIG